MIVEYFGVGEFRTGDLFLYILSEIQPKYEIEIQIENKTRKSK